MWVCRQHSTSVCLWHSVNELMISCILHVPVGLSKDCVNTVTVQLFSLRKQHVNWIPYSPLLCTSLISSMNTGNPERVLKMTSIFLQFTVWRLWEQLEIGQLCFSKSGFIFYLYWDNMRPVRVHTTQLEKKLLFYLAWCLCRCTCEDLRKKLYTHYIR